MRSGIASFALVFFLLSVLSCSRPESRVVGTWINDKTASTIEFKSDKTGVIHQRSQVNLPADLAFKWTMNGDALKVEVNVTGAAPATALGHLEGRDTLVLEKDTFKKMK